MEISRNIADIKNKIGDNVTLVAVSKTKPNEAIEEAYCSGHKIFGENKVQELVNKAESLPKDIEWHMIGHLQTNKVKYIAPFVYLIHAVDSMKLLSVINKEAAKNNRIIRFLFQIKIAEEESKFGLDYEQVAEILNSEEYKKMNNVKVLGLMGMATFTEDEEVVRKEFRQLKTYFNKLKEEYFSRDDDFCELSMGMSDDYLIAIEEGATIVRIGSTIFGQRNYL